MLRRRFTTIALLGLGGTIIAGALAFAIALAAPTAWEESLSAVAQRAVIDSLPRQFEGQKDWGHTTKVVDGLRLRDDDDKLKLRKHESEVKDGLWRRYKGEIVDPEHQLKLRVENLHQTADDHAALQVTGSAHMHLQAWLEQWKDGVKLLNASCDAQCTIDAKIDCEMAWHWTSGTPGKLLGDITVEPKVTAVQLNLTEFELDKLSKIEGWAAREMGGTVKGLIQQKLHDEEPKIVEKLNKAIAKNQKRLHFSVDKAVDTGWTKLQSLLGY